MNEIRELHQTIEKMKDKLFAGDVDSLLFSAKDVNGLNAAHAGGNRGFACNAEGADLGGIINVSAAAEFDGLAAHVDHTDNIAVFFAEQCDRAKLLRLCDGHFFCLDGHAVQHKFTHEAADLDQFVGRNGREMRKIKVLYLPILLLGINCHLIQQQ